MNVLEVKVGNEATFAEVMVGESSTLIVKLCVAVPAVLEAVTGMTYEPTAVGVPFNDADPSPLSVKLTPGGRSAGGAETAGMGSPALCTRKWIGSPMCPVGKVWGVIVGVVGFSRNGAVNAELLLRLLESSPTHKAQY